LNKSWIWRYTRVLDEWANLKERVAIVTGGAGGLGRPITEDLVRAGVRLAICDRDPEAVDSIKEWLKTAKSDALVECFDVRDSERLASFFGQVDERFGKLDILVNVPGGTYRQPTVDVRPNGVQAVIKENFTHVFEACQLAARRMENGPGGSIISITTIEAHRAMPTEAVYGAMKAGVEHLTRTLAVEWGPKGIRVNTVAPDMFPTANSMRSFFGQDSPVSDEVMSRRNSDRVNEIIIPLGRKGIGTDLSGCILFLASDLSAYVTGTTIHLDGGTLAASGWMRWPDGYNNVVPDSIVKLMDEQSGSE
jgi:NAD(P)-dependent dehydrogenase (short-subunit alcohol dehydrogenase family)